MKILSRILLVVALGVGLSSCAAWHKVQDAYSVVTSASTTPQQVYIAANAFDAIEASAAQYLRLPVCGGDARVCRSASATKPIVASIRSGRLARNRLESAVSANPGAPVEVSLYSTLLAATSTIKSILTAYGVN